MSKPACTTMLIILDGFGFREESKDNAIAAAQTPNWDRLWAQAPHTLISSSGLDVGLPEGQMGNSEVGHMSLGAGRIIYQSITRIDKAIADGDFDNNKIYTDAIDNAVANGKAVHILGLLSAGGVHSHEQHIFQAIRLAVKRGAEAVYPHAFLDGRDTPPKSAQSSIEAAEAVFAELGVGCIASLHGRYWAMDRDNRWDRVTKSYRLLTEGMGEYAYTSAQAALAAAYERGETDEFVAPSEIGERAPLQEGDAVLFMNFRADRARQMTQALTDSQFAGFERDVWPQINMVTTTEYSAALSCPVAFPPENVRDSLGEIVARQGLKQLRIAETEKYAHVTFFFSGGREDVFENETRALIPSPNVATYDLKPEMSAHEVTDQLVDAINSDQYSLIVVNFANGDMVGHTGNFGAAVKAVEALDGCIGRVEAALLTKGGQALITADHGNCEQMLDYDSGQAHTQHTTDPVPLVLIGNKLEGLASHTGILADVAPTILDMMGIEKPSTMTGTSLLTNSR